MKNERAVNWWRERERGFRRVVCEANVGYYRGMAESPMARLSMFAV